MSLREAAERLLERWESQQDMDTKAGEALFDALRAALAESAMAEPDGWVVVSGGYMRAVFATKAAADNYASGPYSDTHARVARPFRFVDGGDAPKAEPVAWRLKHDPWGSGEWRISFSEKPGWEPLYTRPPKPVDEEVIAECERIEGRTWWSGGTWLYHGDTVVVRRAVLAHGRKG